VYTNTKIETFSEILTGYEFSRGLIMKFDSFDGHPIVCFQPQLCLVVIGGLFKHKADGERNVETNG
jgi:hypothetical protein